ncbi:MAG: hypothetical protein AAFQ68_06880 [Bacteroidota bacterium]
MDNSIENIWKQGFLHQDALVAPRINDLYNQKSLHVIAQFRRMYRRNHIGILIAAALVLVISVLLQTFISGLILSLLLLGLVYYSRRQEEKLARIDKGDNSYRYLCALRDALEQIMDNFGRIYRWLYPLILLVFSWGIWQVEIGDFNLQEAVLSAIPDLTLIAGVPLLPASFVIGVAVVMGFMAERIFQEEVDVVYGQVLGKLHELISDMEELRQS